MTPEVSIILPTYNRAAFLPQAFASITAQTWVDWQLIVVDDGSTDRTREAVGTLARGCTQKVEYIFRENGGAAAARNSGLDRATAPYVAFFDSDDVWLPEYLERSVRALEANPDVDWVFSPCRVVDFATGTELEADTFRMGGHPRPFLALRAETREGGLKAITDPRALESQLGHGMSCGPQNSVLRRRVFDGRRFFEQLRVVEDQVLAICALADGRRLGYLLEPQVIYHVHDGNWSFAAKENSAEKHIDVFGRFVGVLDQLLLELPLNSRQRRAFKRRLADEYFWHFGYNGLWQAGRRREAVAAFARSLSLSPYGLGRWKTFLLAQLRLHAAALRA
jgi:glycosyltransferase involved in cell wall biosynthesis